VANAFHDWSSTHGLERLRSALRRAGQALRRLFGPRDGGLTTLFRRWRFSRHKHESSG
jgi:hypothetical protein